MRATRGVRCGLLALCAACGHVRNDTPGPNGSAGAWTDAPDGEPGTHWLALLNDHVELVRFDENSPPTRVIVADSLQPGLVTAAFSDDGKQLAYASPQAGTWELHVVSAPIGVANSRSWAIAESTPTLYWLGSNALLAWGRSDGPSRWVRTDQDAPLDLGFVSRPEGSADQSALIAIANADRRLLYLDGAAPPAWSEALPDDATARLAADGRALALFSRSAIPAQAFPLPTMRIQWSPPASPTCTMFTPYTPCPTVPIYSVGSVMWQAADSPINAEVQGRSETGADMTVVAIEPSDPTTIAVPSVYYPFLSRNWGVDSAGRTFIAANADDVSKPWWVELHARGLESSRVTGFPGFAQYAALSGDQQSLLVVGYLKSTNTSTLYSAAYPPVESSPPLPLFTSNEVIGALLPQPGGPRFIVGTGALAFDDNCADFASSDCDSLVYELSDGQSPPQPLPAGLEDPQWTADGAGIIANLADGSVVYLDPSAPDQPKLLGRGGFVLPKHW